MAAYRAQARRHRVSGSTSSEVSRMGEVELPAAEALRQVFGELLRYDHPLQALTTWFGIAKE
ncbi:hypothetical protein ACFWY5_49130 [Nonomuraea sp. NPDC059007]|uniref:hypothetical protein n=1 Tax=Nonomuraea sp. NPDC059007 TaxID=3346692 RepID=UPI0036A59118